MPLSIQIHNDFKELALLAATVTECHSSAIFLPTELLSASSPSRTFSKGSLTGGGSLNAVDTIRLSHIVEPGLDPRRSSIDLVAVHSHSKLVKDCRLQVGSGLLGWVAEQGRPIHLTPYDVGSQAIGIYLDHEPIKSLVAVPISITQGHSTRGEPHGVLMCDSLRPDSFSHSHVKALELIATVIQRLILLSHDRSETTHFETSWEHFKRKTSDLGEAIGANSIEILRLRVDSFQELETSVGMTAAVRHTEQFVRLAQQALPPHFPLVRLPNGDLIISIDNMMSAFFQQKLQSLANHLHTTQKPLNISIHNFSAKLSTSGECNLDLTLQQKPLHIRTSTNMGGARA